MSAEDEVDVSRVVRAVFPVQARQAHAVPERPYAPRSPWAHDPVRHLRVLRDEPADELPGATAQNGYVAHPYRCRLCETNLTSEDIDHHNCQGEQ